MAKIARHSSRLMGFHVRDYRRGDGQETEMFTCRIFLNETEAGFARNGGEGGPDFIHIHPEHRAAWTLLVAYLDQHPTAVRDDGTRDEYLPGEEAARMVLRDLHEAESRLFRSPKQRSGLLAYTWERPFAGGSWWANPVTLFTPAPHADPDRADADLFHILVLGTDNAGFIRPDAPLPQN